MMKSVNISDLKSDGASLVGSSPTGSTWVVEDTYNALPRRRAIVSEDEPDNSEGMLHESLCPFCKKRMRIKKCVDGHFMYCEEHGGGWPLKTKDEYILEKLNAR